MQTDHFSLDALLTDDGQSSAAGATDEVIRRWEEKRARITLVKGLIAEYESQIARLQNELSELTRQSPDATAA